MLNPDNVKFDLGWGNPYFLLEILSKSYVQKLSPYDISTMNYAEDDGVLRLIKLTRETIYSTTGLKYKYITIVNGATHGINVVLKHMYKNGYKSVITRKYGYPFYDHMIENSGLVRKSDLNSQKLDSDFLLIDSPSNPEGLQTSLECAVWDSVYHSKIYSSDLKTVPTHAINVGSYSKLLGITGGRVGWIATNNAFLSKTLSNIALYDTATVSVPSQLMTVDILEKINLSDFLKKGRASLNNNKEELSKVSYLFGNQTIPESGMFYCVYVDSKAIGLLKKCGINYVKLDDNFIRLNIGQSMSVIKNAVKSVLKKDKKGKV